MRFILLRIMLPDIKLLVFDLDGTLVDSETTIFEATTSSLRRMNVPHNFTKEEFRTMIGHHFLTVFNKFDVHVTDIESYLNIYKPFYNSLLDKSTLYADVEETLKVLKAAGYEIALLTTKSQEQANNVLRHFNLLKYFSIVNGRTPESEVKPSPAPLLSICQTLGYATSESLMIGDSELDIQCGINAKAKTCAVTYGFRTPEQLVLEKPDFIVNSLKELQQLLC